ncbi:hypothetical protein ACMFMG_012216 [Clarireedia jacksonii]
MPFSSKALLSVLRSCSGEIASYWSRIRISRLATFLAFLIGFLASTVVHDWSALAAAIEAKVRLALTLSSALSPALSKTVGLALDFSTLRDLAMV